MKKRRRVLLVTLIWGMSLLMHGCTQYHNQSWDDLTPKEQEEVQQILQQTFHDVKKDLETMYLQEECTDRMGQGMGEETSMVLVDCTVYEAGSPVALENGGCT